MNYEIRKLEDDLISVLNASSVPIEAKRLILADILRLVEKKSEGSIALEIRIMKEEEEYENGVQEDKLAEYTEHKHTTKRGEPQSHGGGHL